jgi:predicted ATPase/class 3 adenylate cyclase
VDTKGQLPTGTVTFLLTDVEGSSRLWQDHSSAMADVIERHDQIIRSASEEHAGALVKSKGEGDSTFSVFTRPTDAVAAAVAAQQALQRESWSDGIELKVRAALHTGEAELRHGDYYGTVVNRCARLRALAHGGQTLLSQATEELVAEALSGDVSLIDLGPQRLRDLDRPERVFQLCAEGFPDEFPRLQSARVVTNLPGQRTSFVGRTREAEEVRGLLAKERMVTLIGVGGCGKTRLALHVAADVAESFGDGIFFCDLAPISDGESVDRVVSQAVRLAGGTGDLRTDLLTFLEPRDTMLVFDNCEHLVDECADLADAVLASCPAVKILATSREGLRVDGEQAYSVPPLGVGKGSKAKDSEAVRLFADRARVERANFNLDEHLEAVVDICRRLDGVPLAIELAAARVSHLMPEQIRERLSTQFQLLTGGRRRVQRQQTLAAALDWSHDLLNDAEQRLLRRLAVFAGGFTLEAAEAICADVDGPHVLDLLGSLVAKSLVDTDEVGGSVRYRLLETVRLYAEQKLLDAGEAAAYRSGHRDWFLAWIEAFPQGPAIFSGYYDIRAEIPNVRTAIEWSSGEGSPALVARLAAAIYPVMDPFPHEARAWLDLGEPGFDDLEPEQQARWLFGRGWNAFTLIDVPRIQELRQAIEIGGDNTWPILAPAYGLWAIAVSYGALNARESGGNGDELARSALSFLDESVRRGQWFGQGDFFTSAVYMNLDMLEEVVEYCRAHRVRPADTFADLYFVWNDAAETIAAHLLGRDQAALDASGRTLDNVSMIYDFDSDYIQVAVVAPRAVALAGVGRADEGRAYIREMLPDLSELRLPLIVNSLVVALASMAGADGDWERAAILHSATQVAGGMFRDWTGFALFRNYRARMEQHLDPETLERCRRLGAAMTLPEALALGLESRSDKSQPSRDGSSRMSSNTTVPSPRNTSASVTPPA